MVLRQLLSLVLPIGLGLVAAAALVSVLPAPYAGPVDVACVGPDPAQYERCIAELPTQGARLGEAVRAADATTRPILAVAGGVLVALLALLLLRSRRRVPPPVDDRWALVARHEPSSQAEVQG